MHLVCVGALHAVHAVVGEGEVGALQQRLDGAEVEDALEQVDVRLRGAVPSQKERRE